MRALILCADPRGADVERDSAALALRDLGCELAMVRFDLDGLDEARLASRPPQVVLVDARDAVELGYGAIRRLKTLDPLAAVPVLLVVTTRRLQALDPAAGADDFALHPVVPAELYARVRALDWRLSRFAGEERLKVGELAVDLAAYEARYRGRLLALTRKEFDLLRFLAQHRGRVFSREQLLRQVWGMRHAEGTRTVDIHVRRLRAKLGVDGGGLIETVRSVGYKLRDA